jgi:hypothetical protein
MFKRPTSNSLSIKRKFYFNSWVWTTTTTSDFWRYQETLASAIPAFSEYTALFDTYRISAVKWTYMPRYDSVEASTAGTTGSPTAYAHVVIDPQSTVIPSGTYGSSTLNILMENTKVKTYKASRPFSVYYKPKILMQGFGGGSASVVRSPPNIRTTDLGVSHRGHHIYIQQNNFSASANANIIFDVFCTVYLQLKNLK